jgi:hypothetical protein
VVGAAFRFRQALDQAVLHRIEGIARLGRGLRFELMGTIKALTGVVEMGAHALKGRDANA